MVLILGIVRKCKQARNALGTDRELSADLVSARTKLVEAPTLGAERTKHVRPTLGAARPFPTHPLATSRAAVVTIRTDRYLETDAYAEGGGETS